MGPRLHGTTVAAARESGEAAGASRTAAAAAATPMLAPQQLPRRQQQQQQQQESNWAQRAAAAAALPQSDFKRVGRNGKPEREPIKGSIPHDERGIVFERAAGVPQINPGVATSMAAFVNAFSKVAPAQIQTKAFRISVQGRLLATAHFGASVAMLLRFKKEILEATRKADRPIINVDMNETCLNHCYDKMHSS